MRKIISMLLFLSVASFGALSPCTLTWPDINNETQPKVVHVDVNFVDLKDCDNENRDTLNNILSAMGGSTGSTGLSSTGDIKATIDRDSNTTGSRFWVANHTNDTLFRVADDSTIKIFGALKLNPLTASLPLFTDANKNITTNAMTGTGSVVMSASPTLTGTIAGANQTLSGSLTIGTTATTTGVHTFTAAPVFSSATASLPMFTDGSKALVSNAMTGTGSVVMSSSPTLTGTIAGANATLSGTLGVTGTTTLGKLILGSGSYGSGSAQMFTTSNEGLLIYGKTGSTYDLAISNAANTANVLAVPTGTNNVLFPGTLGVGSNYLNVNSSGRTIVNSGSDHGETFQVSGTGYFSGAVSMASSLGTDGLYTASGGILVQTGGNGVGRLGYFSESGVQLRGSSGSLYDLSLLSSGGAYLFGNPTGTNSVVFPNAVSLSSTLGVTGITTLGNKINFGSGSFSAGSAQAYTDASSGLVLVGKAGSVYDLVLTNGDGTNVLRVPTGTSNATFPSAPVFSSANASEFLMTDGSKALTSVSGSGSGSVVRATSPTITSPTVATSLTASYATASTAAEFDGSKNLVSVTKTGTGNDVYSDSPTLTGTIAAASQTLSGSLTIGTTATTTGVHTFTAAPVFSSATASQAVFTNGSKALVSNAITGTGNVVMSASPTLTGTIAGASATLSGTLGVTGAATAATIALGGNEAFDYNEGTFTVAATGFSACTVGSLSGSTCTGTAHYTRVGKMVVLRIPQLYGTSNSTSLTLTGLPAEIQPNNSQIVSVEEIFENSFSYSGIFAINSGTISPYFRTSFTNTTGGNTYTSSGIKGFLTKTISYTIQ